MPSRLAAVFSILLPLGVGVGCDRTSGSRAEPTSRASADASTSGEQGELPAPGANASTAPAASSAAAPSPLAGTWTGTYEAKRAPIKLSRATPWPAWKRDAGKQVGKGTAELDIDASGAVHGKAAGPLGPMMLSGRVEDGLLRASATPEDPTADGTMSGVLTGELRGESIHATLRASNRRGEAVRAAVLVLKRK